MHKKSVVETYNSNGVTQYDMFMVFKVLEINCTLMQDLFC